MLDIIARKFCCVDEIFVCAWEITASMLVKGDYVRFGEIVRMTERLLVSSGMNVPVLRLSGALFL